MGFIGKGRIFPEERIGARGERAIWHVVVFVDSTDGLEHEVGKCLDLEYAHAILKRWEKETLFEAPPAPVKYSSENGVRRSQSNRFKKSVSVTIN